MVNVRLVHLPDEQKRRELMIIYAENAESAGVEWRDLILAESLLTSGQILQRALIESATKRVVFSHEC
jgi:hypothetical protein